MTGGSARAPEIICRYLYTDYGCVAVAQFKGDSSGLQGCGRGPEQACADLLDTQAWEAERAALDQSSPAQRFGRASDSLLREVAREARWGGWTVTKQRTSFDSEAGGLVEVALHWDSQTGKAFPSVRRVR